MTPWEDRQLIEAFDEEFEELVHFAAGSVVDCGFGYMDRNGVVDPSKPVELWITGRMTYVFALAALKGYDWAIPLVDHGLDQPARDHHLGQQGHPLCARLPEAAQGWT